MNSFMARFTAIVEQWGFAPQNEIDDGPTYAIEYRSNVFVLKLEKYRREFYATVYKTGTVGPEVNLFNLLAYLSQSAQNVPVAQFYHEEEDLEECYRKQLDHIACVLCDNLAAVTRFCGAGDYASRVADVGVFMVNKYPELFKRET
ncbi:MAG: hypothetical protein NTV86_07915 [Planctomycetota bacterium]|nr:hypothetical protein [Planctomycetota bacterium]